MDPQKRQKSSISKVPEPRKLSSRLDGSSIFTFSPVSYPNPKILNFGGFLGAFWEPFGSHLASLAPLGPPWGVPGAPRTALFGDCFSMDFFVYLFEAILVPKPLQNGRGASLKAKPFSPLLGPVRARTGKLCSAFSCRAEPSQDKPNEPAAAGAETYQEPYQEPTRDLPGP